MSTITHTITYYASDDTMGDTSPQECDYFRSWAKAELEREYPQHEIRVSDVPSHRQFETTDEDHRDEIADFCSRLWDRCPWE